MSRSLSNVVDEKQEKKFLLIGALIALFVVLFGLAIISVGIFLTDVAQTKTQIKNIGLVTSFIGAISFSALMIYFIHSPKNWMNKKSE